MPDRSVQNERSAGASRGTFSLGDCLADGAKAGAEASQAAGFGDGRFVAIPEAVAVESAPPRHLWIMPKPAGSRKISFNVSEQYDIQDVVGEGAYGVVW